MNSSEKTQFRFGQYAFRAGRKIRKNTGLYFRLGYVSLCPSRIKTCDGNKCNECLLRKDAHKTYHLLKDTKPRQINPLLILSEWRKRYPFHSFNRQEAWNMETKLIKDLLKDPEKVIATGKQEGWWGY